MIKKLLKWIKGLFCRKKPATKKVHDKIDITVPIRKKRAPKAKK